jgi:hypothetical protein
LALTDEEVERSLDDVMARFDGRHHYLTDTFLRHADELSDRIDASFSGQPSRVNTPLRVPRFAIRASSSIRIKRESARAVLDSLSASGESAKATGPQSGFGPGPSPVRTPLNLIPRQPLPSLDVTARHSSSPRSSEGNSVVSAEAAKTQTTSWAGSESDLPRQTWRNVLDSWRSRRRLANRHEGLSASYEGSPNGATPYSSKRTTL